MIEGVESKQLAKHADERGFLMEILRSDDSIFTKFGLAPATLIIFFMLVSSTGLRPPAARQDTAES